MLIRDPRVSLLYYEQWKDKWKYFYVSGFKLTHVFK